MGDRGGARGTAGAGWLSSLKADRLTGGRSQPYLHAAPEAAAHGHLVFRHAPHHETPHLQPRELVPDLHRVLRGGETPPSGNTCAPARASDGGQAWLRLGGDAAVRAAGPEPPRGPRGCIPAGEGRGVRGQHPHLLADSTREPQDGGDREATHAESKEPRPDPRGQEVNPWDPTAVHSQSQAAGEPGHQGSWGTTPRRVGFLAQRPHRSATRAEVAHPWDTANWMQSRTCRSGTPPPVWDERASLRSRAPHGTWSHCPMACLRRPLRGTHVSCISVPQTHSAERSHHSRRLC